MAIKAFLDYISLEKKYSDSIKNECKKLGINYWRALKRKQQGMSKEKVFYSDY